MSTDAKPEPTVVKNENDLVRISTLAGIVATAVFTAYGAFVDGRGHTKPPAPVIEPVADPCTVLPMPTEELKKLVADAVKDAVDPLRADIADVDEKLDDLATKKSR